MRFGFGGLQARQEQSYLRRADALKQPGTIAEIIEFRNGQAHVLRAGVIEIVVNAHQALGLRKRPRAQENSVDDGEDGDVAADTKR